MIAKCPRTPGQLLEIMEECLLGLDLLGAGLPAAHLDHAIELMRNQFDLNEITSISEQSGHPLPPLAG